MDKIKKNFGFGCMRFPMIGEEIDEAQVSQMVDYFLDQGFNYFDTAHGYIGERSELAVKNCLTSRYPRESYILTNKLTAAYFEKEEDICPFFESQLERCGVDYFDFYLMHAQGMGNYPKFKECHAYETALTFKEEGKIRHFGISFHDRAEVLEQILTEYPQIEVVQIQFNYADFDDPAVQAGKCYEICRKHGIDGIVVIGGDGSYRGAQALSRLGINTIGLPGTIDLDIACTEYTIGFDTAVNTAMQAIDKVKDTSSSHERCSIIEVMGRNAGYIALWCGIANGAEDILLPEKYDYNEQNIINNIITNRKHGKTHHIIINAEGIGHSTSMARRIEAATGIETRATILGYMQRGGSPTAKDRYYASIMGAYAVDIMLEGKTNRVVGYQHGEFIDFDIEDALQMEKGINDYQFEVSHLLSI